LRAQARIAYNPSQVAHSPFGCEQAGRDSEAIVEERENVLIDIEHAWSRVLARLQPRIDQKAFDTIIRRLQPVLLTDREIRLLAPSRLSLTYVTENLLGTLSEEVEEVVGRRLVVVDLSPEGQGELFPTDRSDAQAKTWPGRLNPRYTFDNFIVGASNQFAHAASKAVATRPGRHYNPLFVYGGVGLGKTHLVNAIAFEVLRVTPTARVVYLSSEEFTTELISSIQHDEMEEFKQRFRVVDLLIVDDVQFLAGRDRTQEEFFHTFNVLHSAGKQIVVTSDVTPQEMRGLEERLRNRFEWGLIADVKPPDLETRAAIVERKAEFNGIPLDGEATVLIAEHVTSNVRELEGILTRLGALASLAGHRVTAKFVEESLKQHPRSTDVGLSLDRIATTVCEHFAVTRSDLFSRRRSRHIALPRQVAMYLCRMHLRASYPRIGELFERDHSTAIHAISTTEARLRRDTTFQEMVGRIERALGVREL
jgi:chromosomal replication initiator protein